MVFKINVLFLHMKKLMIEINVMTYGYKTTEMLRCRC